MNYFRLGSMKRPWQEHDKATVQNSQYLLARMWWVRRRKTEMKMERKQGPSYDEEFQFDYLNLKVIEAIERF